MVVMTEATDIMTSTMMKAVVMTTVMETMVMVMVRTGTRRP